ncbi:menaquinone biosynthetic enzyme MqnA/MqnD family protein [Halodesulfovibrio sp.]|uniref:menaquinone biosynthetic enzyme MqnA/MqnD family protein n=1 Tax=Halodesulfovibrio sp. TaxID=1912772 RepID=UPI0025D7C930|nr:menaquinone biosynthesis protein [Halodesulfovibrio sp.]MCT4535379.1 menaquinone biosynthesis protein [Halodesulfovibrio sp.]
MQESKKVRVGRIRYLNVLPIYHPLESGQLGENFELVYGTPAELNEQMEAGNLDVSSCSSFEYARHPEKYFLLPDIAIGSAGPVMSVLLISQKPISELDGEEILTTAQSHTSAALLRMLFRDCLKQDVSYKTGSVSGYIDKGDLPVAALCIGDEALRLANDERYQYRLDLGEAWREWTGLPFIFGVWIVSRKSVESGCFSQNPVELFANAKQWGRDNIEYVIRLAEKAGYMGSDGLTQYFNSLVYDLGEEEQKGLRLFMKRLAEAGEIPFAPELEFYSHTC